MKSSVTASDAPPDPLIGQSVAGKFRIDRLIGRGGVGLVYLARQADLARDVVVKVLAPNWEQDADALARFDREAKRLSGLHHPNIVEMYEHGHDKGRSYLVMEYLQGELLSEYIARKQRLTLDEFVPIAAQVLKGIGHVHSRELMVRDVKPANIMLCERKGRANFVKILDFGLAKLLRGDTAITEEHVMGTVGYLAPEAIKGEPVDLRVDVYAIGVLFFHMLAGRLPFDDDTNAPVFYKTVHEAPPDLRELLGANHEVPEGLIELIEACLAKEPSQRPSDADHVIEILIDVVPASLFRLPRASGQRSGATRLEPAGAGNTGMIELIRARAEPPLPPGKATPVPGSIPAVEPVSAISEETGQGTPMLAEPPPPRRASTRLIAASVGLGALLAIVGLGALLVATDDDEKTPAVSKSTASPSAADAIDLAAEVDAIAAHIDAGELEPATAGLDRVRSLLGDDADAKRLRARVDRLDKRLLVERLASTAAKLEHEGDIAAAMSAYRDALQADPTHERSRRALARLTAAADEQASAEAEIVASPEDGIDVDAGKRASGKTLRTPSGKRGKTAGPSEKPGPASTSPPLVGDPSPRNNSTADKPDGKGQDTFLPTKKSGSNDPFLPTGKTP